MKTFCKYFLILIILFNSGIFLLYGTAKLAGWQLAMKHKPSETVLLKDVPPLGIMWRFYSVNRNYAVLVGVTQLLSAALILFKRTRFLGTLLYLVCIGNILALNVFFGITQATLILSSILFVNTLIILFSERKKIIGALAKD